MLLNFGKGKTELTADGIFPGSRHPPVAATCGSVCFQRSCHERASGHYSSSRPMQTKPFFILFTFSPYLNFKGNESSCS